jgi:hypothetical protein
MHHLQPSTAMRKPIEGWSRQFLRSHDFGGGLKRQKDAAARFDQFFAKP